jgi:hypothetical protein
MGGRVVWNVVYCRLGRKGTVEGVVGWEEG